MPSMDERLPRRYDSYRAAMGTGPAPPRFVTFNYDATGGPRWDNTTWRLVPTGTTTTNEREEGNVPTETPRRRCHNCGTREDPFSNYIQWRTIEGDDDHEYCHGCVEGCLGCGANVLRSDARTRGGYCGNCAMSCWNCGNGIDDHRTGGRVYSDHLYCNGCMSQCPGCGDWEPSDDMISPRHGGVEGRVYCDECVTYCDDCDVYNVGACSCQSTDRVRGYGTTAATMWLGGPLPHNDETNEDNGYYIGFELEIAAQNSDYGRRGGADVTPIKDWAEEHLGAREALDCKHDGSVQGFEIASQPMTPEFFENVDWESFMEVLNQHYPLSYHGWTDEPREHGLHVHIGRVAFRRDDVAMAAYSYLLSQDDHLERIGRRDAYHYCPKVLKPVSATVVHSKPYGRQGNRLRNEGVGAGRDAVNLTNGRTIEIRAFKSTRKANELRDAVRVTYLAAEYIRELRSGGWKSTSQALHWLEFAAWVGTHYPQAFASISGITTKPGSNRFPECPKFWV